MSSTHIYTQIQGYKALTFIQGYRVNAKPKRAMGILYYGINIDNEKKIISLTLPYLIALYKLIKKMNHTKLFKTRFLEYPQISDNPYKDTSIQKRINK